MSISTTTAKACNKCGAEKPLAAFGPKPRGKFGRESHCRECRRAYHRKQAGWRPDPLLPGEVWRSIPGYEGLYSVSNFGRVRRDKHSRGARGGKIRAQGIDRKGYPQLWLRKGDKGRTWRVHRLVARAFLGPDNGLTVNHIDGNKTNNQPGNLEYVTNEANYAHARELGLIPNGNDFSAAKLSPDSVREIRKLRERGWTYKLIAERFKVVPSTVEAVVYGHTWTHVK
jgi:hypothetical protein